MKSAPSQTAFSNAGRDEGRGQADENHRRGEDGRDNQPVDEVGQPPAPQDKGIETEANSQRQRDKRPATRPLYRGADWAILPPPATKRTVQNVNQGYPGRDAGSDQPIVQV